MVRASRLAVAFAVVGSVLLVVSTGAASWAPGGPTDELQEGLQLQPTSDYAYLSDDGETVIDISPSNDALRGEGLNPNAVVIIDDVATLRNGGDTNAAVWVTTDAGDPITVEADGQPIDGQATNVTLLPTETLGIDLVINTTNRTGVEAVSTLSVHGQIVEPEPSEGGFTFAEETEPPEPIVRVTSPEPDRRVMTVEYARTERTFTGNLSGLAVGSGIELDAARVAVGDPGNLSVDLQPATDVPARAVTNATGQTLLAAFDVGHQNGPAVTGLELEATVPASALPDGTSLGDMTVYRATDGGWEPVATAVERTAGTLQITAEPGQPGRFVVASSVPAFAVESATLLENESTGTGVSAIVRNLGTGVGNETVTVTANGQPFVNRTVSLPPGATRTITVTAPEPTAENLTIAVDGIVAGTFNRTPSGPTVTANGGLENPSASADNPSETTSSPSEPAQTGSLLEEPAGIPLSRIGGLGIAGGLFVALVSLLRRVPV